MVLSLFFEGALLEIVNGLVIDFQGLGREEFEGGIEEFVHGVESHHFLLDDLDFAEEFVHFETGILVFLVDDGEQDGA